MNIEFTLEELGRIQAALFVAASLAMVSEPEMGKQFIDLKKKIDESVELRGKK